MTAQQRKLVEAGSALFQKYGWDTPAIEFFKKPDTPTKHSIYKRFTGFVAYRTACRAVSVGADLTVDEQDQFTEGYSGNTGVLESKSRRVTSLDDAIRHFGVDLEVWEVDRYTVNKWEVGAKNMASKIEVTPLFQVKVWLKRKVPNNAEGAIKALIDDMKQYAPVYPKVRRARLPREKVMVEIAIADLHLAKLAWANEVGEDYDTAIAERDYLNAVGELAGRVGHLNIERFVLPHGNDLLHVDNSRNMTTGGTPQDVDTRWQRAFHHASLLTVKAIDTILAPIAPVEMLTIPGNHDHERMFYLGEVLDAWYRNSARVKVDNSPSPRKYYQYGVNLIGYTHGKDEKMQDLPLIMAAEEPVKWGAAKFREIHMGHRHRKGEMKFLAGDTYNGVTVRVLPSLCATDAWHHGKGFVKGRRAAEAYVYHPETGYVGHFSSNVIV